MTNNFPSVTAISQLFGAGKQLGTSDLPRAFSFQFRYIDRMQEYMEISIADILGPGSAFTPMPSLVSCHGQGCLILGPRRPLTPWPWSPGLDPASPPRSLVQVSS